MMLFESRNGMKQFGQKLIMAAGVCSLVGCASIQDEDKVDAVGSHLAQPAPGAPRMAPTEAGDIAIAGQEFSHSIMDLPAVSGASVPPLVRFNGVTSIINPPIDTEPYTGLLRDRLLLITREKLRFIEHTLPPYIPGKKHKSESQPAQNTSDPDYQILAELRGRPDADFYKIQIEFVDIHNSDVLFTGLYRIRREGPSEQASDSAPESQQIQAPPQSEPPPSPPQQSSSGGANPIY
jgi:hypothetical protein